MRIAPTEPNKSQVPGPEARIIVNFQSPHTHNFPLQIPTCTPVLLNLIYSIKTNFYDCLALAAAPSAAEEFLPNSIGIR
jgi:hypothetical protein